MRPHPVSPGAATPHAADQDLPKPAAQALAAAAGSPFKDLQQDRSIMNINITTLTENTATRDFMAEWGLSILIEADNKRILLDTGAGFSAAYNAQLAGIDFKSIDLIILSHGHFDHTGGLKDILTRRLKAIDIIAHMGGKVFSDG